ncbi:hypothetical protein DEO72_LG1g1048 [Vigna unguiculata]|uniref:Uncharacterized protein n=1 Tax=Vigna unguiculata TaxID=3917 RepID=A0A4D6KJA8_VIGUN|nr:hypothetical protein DEO72_LG1g1046 [Vigna unguiculata]QCD77424.1 hypothetical protein DEO72_LG1g1048 [Vigna unguiculata]
MFCLCEEISSRAKFPKSAVRLAAFRFSGSGLCVVGSVVQLLGSTSERWTRTKVGSFGFLLEWLA